jgi:hypothetical protein
MFGGTWPFPQTSIAIANMSRLIVALIMNTRASG